MQPMTCSEADERYATARMFGSEYGTGLIEHAQHCDRPDWTHALPTEHWDMVRAARIRRAFA